MTIFDDAIAFVLGSDIEGGFGNDPRDKGNWTSGIVGVGYMNGTKYGISAAAYPHIDIAALTLEQAKEIYRKDYWSLINGDALGKLGLIVLDEAINAGPRKAGVLLQAVLGIEQDGKIGDVTLAALAEANMDDTIIGFTTRRIIDYTLDNGWTVNKKGWTHRAVKAAILATNLKGD